MKKLVSILLLALPGCVLAAPDIQDQSKLVAAFAGDPAEWRISLRSDSANLAVSTVVEHPHDSNLVVVRQSGLTAYELTSSGTWARDDDRRILRPGAIIPLQQFHLAVLEFPTAVNKVSTTPELRQELRVVVVGKYLAIKTTSDRLRRSKGPQYLHVETPERIYDFDLRYGRGGASVYRVVAEQ